MNGFTADKATIKRLFNLLYAREPSDPEVEKLEQLGIGQSESRRQTLRRLIAAMEQYTTPTDFTIRLREEDLRTADCDGFRLFYDETDVALGQHLGVGYSYEANLVAFLRAHLQPGMTFCDVGANIGFFTMIAANLVGEKGSVIAFEPNSENCRLIMLSLRRAGIGNASVIAVALGAETGSALFSLAYGSNGTLVVDDGDALMRPNCIVVPIIPMDDLVKVPVDVIKMDAEGAEGGILKGAERTIERSRPIVTSEFSPDMLHRVSGVSPSQFFGYFTSRDYLVRYLPRDTPGTFHEVLDAAGFMSTYGSDFRIEDFAFIPREKADG